MDPNQCGGSNPVKDFSRLTLEDRSRQQDRVTSSNRNAQSFRAGGVNGGSQANADFAQFQGVGGALPAAHQPNSYRPNAFAQGSMQPGYQFRQPFSGNSASGNFQTTTSPGGSETYTSLGPLDHGNGYGPAAQPNANQFAVQHPSTMNAPASGFGQHLGQPGPGPPGAFQPGPGFQGQGPSPTAPGWRHLPALNHHAAQPHRFPNFGPAVGQAPLVGRYPQFGPGVAPHPGSHAFSNMFHHGQSQGAPAQTRTQARQDAALQRQYDHEFQDAMDQWMSQHSDVANLNQANAQPRNTVSSNATNGSTATPTEAHTQRGHANSSNAANGATAPPRETLREHVLRDASERRLAYAWFGHAGPTRASQDGVNLDHTETLMQHAHRTAAERAERASSGAGFFLPYEHEALREAEQRNRGRELTPNQFFEAVAAQEEADLAAEAEVARQTEHTHEVDLAQEASGFELIGQGDQARPDATTARSDGGDPSAQQPERSELSRVAQGIVDAVANNDSPKFTNSQFFRMMRGMADEDIVIEGRDVVRREESAAAGSSAGGSGSHVTGSTAGTQQQNSSVVGSPTAAGATRSSRDTASTAEDRGTAASGVAREDDTKDKGKGKANDVDFDN